MCVILINPQVYIVSTDNNEVFNEETLSRFKQANFLNFNQRPYGCRKIKDDLFICLFFFAERNDN